MERMDSLRKEGTLNRLLVSGPLDSLADRKLGPPTPSYRGPARGVPSLISG